MKRSLYFTLSLLAGCSAAGPATKTADAPDPGQGWYRNAEGLIASGVRPAETIRSDRPDGSFILETPQIHDPLEDMTTFKKAFEDADHEADKRVAKYRGQLGAIHAFWDEKKKILREKYRIDWKSPAELNPTTFYD